MPIRNCEKKKKRHFAASSPVRELIWNDCSLCACVCACVIEWQPWKFSIVVACRCLPVNTPKNALGTSSRYLTSLWIHFGCVCEWANEFFLFIIPFFGSKRYVLWRVTFISVNCCSCVSTVFLCLPPLHLKLRYLTSVRFQTPHRTADANASNIIWCGWPRHWNSHWCSMHMPASMILTAFLWLCTCSVLSKVRWVWFTPRAHMIFIFCATT